MIAIKGLYKAYDGMPVLQGVDLEIQAGETFVILGESGAGKSVLLRQIGGLERPDAGSIKIAGEDITMLGNQALARAREKIGFVFQESALFDYLTVAENVILPLYEHGRLQEIEFEARARQLMNMVHLDQQQGGKYPGQLSGGMKKRVGLARTLSLDPPIIMYDEPTAGLDPIRADSICRLIKRLQLDKKNTALVVTHDLSVMEKVADRLAFLHEGRIIFTGTPDTLCQARIEIISRFVAGHADRRNHV